MLRSPEAYLDEVFPAPEGSAALEFDVVLQGYDRYEVERYFAQVRPVSHVISGDTGIGGKPVSR